MLQYLLLRWKSAAVMSSPAAVMSSPAAVMSSPAAVMSLPADDVQHTETEAAEASWDISYLQRQPEETDRERHLRSEYCYIR